MSKLLAVRNMVIVKVIYEKYMGSIIVPDSAKMYEGDFYGEIVAVGPDDKHNLKVGERIAFVRHEGFSIWTGEEEFLALDEKRIVGRMIEVKHNPTTS